MAGDGNCLFQVSSTYSRPLLYGHSLNRFLLNVPQQFASVFCFKYYFFNFTNEKPALQVSTLTLLLLQILLYGFSLYRQFLWNNLHQSEMEEFTLSLGIKCDHTISQLHIHLMQSVLRTCKFILYSPAPL